MSDDPGATGRGGRVDRRLDAWLHDGLVDEAVAERRRRHWLAEQAREESSLAGLLADLAEHGGRVTVAMRSGRTHRGRVTALGTEFCELATAGRRALLRLRSVAAVQPWPGGPSPTGDRRIDLDLSFAGAVGLVLDGAPTVTAVAGSAPEVRGTVVTVGAAILTVRQLAPDAGLVHLVVDAVDELLIATSA